MEELLKSGRLTHLTVALVAFTMLAFAYPTYMATQSADAFDQATKLQSALDELTRMMVDAEVDERENFIRAANQLTAPKGYEIRDASRQKAPETFVFLDPGHLPDILHDFPLRDVINAVSDEDTDRIEVYRVGNTAAILEAIQRSGNAPGTYIIRRIVRVYGVEDVSLHIELTPPAAHDDIKITIPMRSVLLSQPSEFLRRHRDSGQFLVDGRIVPAVTSRAGMYDTNLRVAVQRFAQEREQKATTVSVIGVSVNAIGLAVLAPLILIALLVQLQAHFSHVRLSLLDLDEKELRTITRFPWTPLYVSRLSSMIDAVTLCVLPSAAALVVVLSLPERLANSRSYRAFAIAESAMIVALAWWAFVQARRVSRAIATSKE